MSSVTDSDDKQPASPYPWQDLLWDQLCQQARSNQLSHALLICGEAGLGKKALARGLADFLLCQNPAERHRCGQCRMCVLAGNTSSDKSGAEAEPPTSQQPDLMILGPSTSSGIIGVEQVRELIEFVNMTSHSAGRKLVIINQAEGLNINASNALLKTLEEPTSNTFIILVTDLPGRLLATLRSRCQRVEVPKPVRSIALNWLNSVTDFDDCATVLNACSGRPVLAKAMIETGEAGLRLEFIEVLSQLINNNINPTDILGKINHLEDRVVVGFLSYTSSILVKYLLKGNDDRGIEIEPVLKNLAQMLTSNGRPRQALSQDLLSLYTEAETARKQLQAGANPNPQLLLESLLWHWSTLASGLK